MMGRYDFAPKLYYQLSLDRLVPADHLLHRIAEAVDFYTLTSRVYKCPISPFLLMPSGFLLVCVMIRNTAFPVATRCQPLIVPEEALL